MQKPSYNAVCGTVLFFLVLGYVGSFFFVRRLRPREFKSEFAAINSLYEKGDYRRAIAAYESLASRYNIQCMSLYYNLANAYYNTDQLGKAILYYRKAERLAPRDKDVVANLRIAQEKAGVAARPRRKSPVRSIGRNLVRLFSLFEGVAASLTFRWLLIVCVVVTIFSGHECRLFLRLSIALAVIFYLFLGATLYKAYVQESSREAVIVYGQSPVRAVPDSEASATRILAEGTTVRIESSRNGWSKIVVDGGKTGWIRERHLAEI